MAKKNDKLIDRVAAIAAEKALEHLEREKKKREKQKHDRRLRNVKLLLRNYRSFAAHCKDIRLEINELDAKLELDDLDTNEFKLESIKRSKEKTLAMVKFINKMLEVYRILCEKSDRPEDLRRYQAIYHMYISENKLTAEEISAMHNVAVRTTFNDIEKACKDLSALVFGIDGVRFFSW